jgi:hypothetical protein
MGRLAYGLDKCMGYIPWWNAAYKINEFLLSMYQA